MLMLLVELVVERLGYSPLPEKLLSNVLSMVSIARVRCIETNLSSYTTKNVLMAPGAAFLVLGEFASCCSHPEYYKVSM